MVANRKDRPSTEMTDVFGDLVTPQLLVVIPPETGSLALVEEYLPGIADLCEENEIDMLVFRCDILEENAGWLRQHSDVSEDPPTSEKFDLEPGLLADFANCRLLG